jgi:anti-sigma B factor antagonist
MKITLRECGDVTIVNVDGILSLGVGSTSLREALRDLARNGHKKIVVNLQDTTYIDSSGIGELFSAYTKFRDIGANLKLLQLTPRVKDLLQITKLYTVFEVFEDEDTAIRSFNNPRSF